MRTHSAVPHLLANSFVELNFCFLPTAIITLNDEEISNASVDSNIQIRGTREALKTVALHFKAEVTSKPPKFFERVVLPFQVKKEVDLGKDDFSLLNIFHLIGS